MLQLSNRHASPCTWCSGHPQSLGPLVLALVQCPQRRRALISLFAPPPPFVNYLGAQLADCNTQMLRLQQRSLRQAHGRWQVSAIGLVGVCIVGNLRLAPSVQVLSATGMSFNTGTFVGAVHRER